MAMKSQKVDSSSFSSSLDRKMILKTKEPKLSIILSQIISFPNKLKPAIWYLVKNLLF